MKSHGSALAFFLVLALALPTALVAQDAGKISSVVPIVNVVRGPQQLSAAATMPVLWGDSINAGHLARARVALNDGSILNVGSDTNLTIAQHDAGAQQTQLELNYGRVRSQAVKLVKPNAKFQIRTPTGVAGVVGTDFFLAFEDYITRIVVFEGQVQFCTLDGRCVIVPAGQMSSIRGNQQPDSPSPAPNVDVMDAANSTQMPSVATSAGMVASHGALLVSTLVAAVVVPAVVVRTTNKTPTCPPAPAAGIRHSATCGGITTVARINGQRPLGP